MNDHLRERREELDSLDTQILTLLCERSRISGELLDWKLSCGLPVEDTRREAEVVERLHELGQGQIRKIVLHDIYEVLFAEAKGSKPSRARPVETRSAKRVNP